MIYSNGIKIASTFFLMTISHSALAFDGSALWLNKNQEGEKLFKQNKPEEALTYFQDPKWKAAAAYRAKEYAYASELLKNISDSESQYNRGNALAQQKQYQEAIDAYDAVLKQNPNHKDAQYNRDIVKKLLIAQEQQQQSNSSQSNSGNNSQNNQNQNNQQTQPPQAAQSSQNQRSSESDPPKPEKSEQEQADEQRLRQIPDDPGGLLRRKFLRDHERMQGR